MAVLLQLSDLHLHGAPHEQAAIFDGLVGALSEFRSRRGPVDLITLTGDVFDSATLDPGEATAAFRRLHDRILEALGGPVPTIIVPGNHDRRRNGVLGPHRNGLFEALRLALGDRAWVHGTTLPFLAELVPQDFHGLPVWVIALDSTHLQRGLLSAGGMIRQEDLLHAAARIGGREPDWPVLLLLHHHLIPTPLTDLGDIEADRTHPVVRWSIQRLLPELIANGDKEELTMTALGAGTALSTLHALGRAVLVLHGHKHYATARLLDATWQDHGDVMIVSAGSCGTAQQWRPGESRDMARLWPSFNAVELTSERIRVQTISFGWKGSSKGAPTTRGLIDAERRGAQWVQAPLPLQRAMGDEPARLEINAMEVDLAPSTTHGPRRWDYTVRRHVVPRPGHAPSRYVETVDGIDEGYVERPEALDPIPIPASIPLTLGDWTTFSVKGGIRRTLSAGGSSPYAWLGLMNRYGSEAATMAVRGLGACAGDAFASATDLGNGLEWPLPVERDGDRVSVRYADCPPRMLVRIYFPLLRAE